MSTVSEDGHKLLQHLITDDILESRQDGEIALTDSFSEEQASYSRTFQDPDTFARAAATFTDGIPINSDALTPEILATARALDETVSNDLDDLELLNIAFRLSTADRSLPTEGVPPAFTPIRGDEIELFANLHPASIVYCWREECATCDTVRGDFEVLIEDELIPEHVGLGAVYGPECSELLFDSYDVAVAPTTLFFVNGSVDARYVGARAPDVFRDEIETIVERASDRTHV